MSPRARSGDLQVAIVWQPKGSRYERRGSLKAYCFAPSGLAMTF